MIIISFIFILLPTYLSHVTTYNLFSKPIPLEEGAAQEVVDAEWKKINNQQKNSAEKINQDWVAFMESYKPDEEDWIEWTYWATYVENSADATTNWFSSAFDDTIMGIKKTFAWGKDTSVKALNETREMVWKGLMSTTFPILRGVYWLFGLIFLFIALMLTLNSGINYATFGGYGVVKNGIKRGSQKISFIPFIVPIVSVFLMVIQLYLAYKFGIMKVVYWCAGLPDLIEPIYSLFGWSVYTNPWYPTLLVSGFCLVIFFLIRSLKRT